MSTICSVGSATTYTPPAKAESRNEPKHDNDADDRGPKALAAAAAAPAANPTSSGVQLSSSSLAALVAMQEH